MHLIFVENTIAYFRQYLGTRDWGLGTGEEIAFMSLPNP
jgi:hypothetical protein